MKKILPFLIAFLFIVLPSKVGASIGQVSYIAKFLSSIKNSSTPIFKDLKVIKRGSYLPEVYDSKILNFQNVSVGAKDAIKKKQEEERKKKLEEQMKLGSAEAAFDGKYIDIDLSSQTLTTFENRAVVSRYKISSGKWSMPTPTGSFSIINKTPRAWSSKYGLYMPYWMGFTGSGHGIHELPEWPGGAKEGSSHLGRPVSHGCVRLGVGSAQAVYGWTNVGDKVYIHK